MSGGTVVTKMQSLITTCKSFKIDTCLHVLASANPRSLHQWKHMHVYECVE